jgi:aspartate beta-hydroxylase
VSFADALEPAEALKAAADRAMLAGDPRSAAASFERALTLAAGRLELWIGLAACRRAMGDAHGALVALEGALAIEPRCFPALLMKGSMLESQGSPKAAAVAYGHALQMAPQETEMAEPTRRARPRARAAHDRYTEDLVSSLRAEAGLGDGSPRSREARRLDTFIQAMAGRRKIYVQEPVRFNYPGLPAIEFFEREDFPWTEDLEARTGAIREELLAVWGERSPELKPYVNYPDGMPLDQWAALNRSRDWSAYFLYEDGRPVESHVLSCPETMAALAVLDQPDIPGRSPSAMFSILKARTRIPPHTGVANTRLVMHLPLVIPDGCGFRVGGETRPWRVGEAWVFDDTIEHEAWNTSDMPRAILICDVWNPHVPASEREMISRLMAALDRFNEQSPGGEL